MIRHALGALVLLASASWAVMPDPSASADPDLVLGEQAVRAARYDAGIPYLRAALTRAPDEPDIHVYLALALRQTGAAEAAAQHYATALRLDPAHKGALAYQGVLLLHTGDRAGAEANLDRLRGLCPSGCNERDELARELARTAAR
jgi:Flp pilus assembly protein TadD